MYPSSRNGVIVGVHSILVVPTVRPPCFSRPYGVRGALLCVALNKMTLGDELHGLGITASKRVLKRAQYEAFELSLFEGDIIVRNASHANPSEHEYRITIQDGRPTKCSCPADANYKGACKHRVGVAIRRPVLEAASEMQVLTDGGRPQSLNSTHSKPMVRSVRALTSTRTSRAGSASALANVASLSDRLNSLATWVLRARLVIPFLPIRHWCSAIAAA